MAKLLPQRRREPPMHTQTLTHSPLQHDTKQFHHLWRQQHQTKFFLEHAKLQANCEKDIRRRIYTPNKYLSYGGYTYVGSRVYKYFLCEIFKNFYPLCDTW